MFAKRELPALACTEKISQKCIIVYDDFMRGERLKIGGDKEWKELYDHACPRSNGVAVAGNESRELLRTKNKSNRKENHRPNGNQNIWPRDQRGK